MNNGPLSCNFHKEYAIVCPASPEIIDQTSLFSIAHLYGENSSNALVKIHSHFVIVVNSDLKPKSHLVGTLNSKETKPFSSTIFIISHFLFQSFSITDQANSLGTETATLSIGSILTQFSVCIITSGAQT
jgi:hypothetical protein